jgi:cytolysin (calcineurin-like family phosphatase)
MTNPVCFSFFCSLTLVLVCCSPSAGPETIVDVVEHLQQDVIATADSRSDVEQKDTVDTIDLAETIPRAPLLPPLRTLADGFHVAPTFPSPGEPFSMIVASDPQLWWNFQNGTGELTDEETEARNLLHVTAMNELITGTNLPIKAPAAIGVIMNGDLTEYGRWAQWDAYYRLYQTVNAPIWDGLGNHDYQNNNRYVSNGCAMQVSDLELWTDACKSGSMETLWDEPACDVVDHFKELWGWCASDTMRRMRHWGKTHEDYLYDFDQGSAAYSWEMGDFHFIQLHNGPDYQVTETTICSALPWLLNDLKSAFERGKYIVLHMHKPISGDMKKHLVGYQYNIVGIFFGHHHQYAGYTGDFVVADIPIPQFYSGSVEWNLFVLAHFTTSSLTVTSIDSSTGTPVHYQDSSDYTNVGSGAVVAAPFTYTYPVHNCPTGQIPDADQTTCLVPPLPTTPIELCY